MSKLPDVIELEVTQEDIDNGRQASARLCPVALALGRLKGASSVSVGLNHASFEFRRKKLRLFESSSYASYRGRDRSMINFIVAFDNVGPDAVKPTKIILEKEDEYPRSRE